MAGQLKIGGNVIATHAGSEGAGTVTLDSSTLTIGSNTTVQGTMTGVIGNDATLPSGTVVSVHQTDIGSDISSSTCPQLLHIKPTLKSTSGVRLL